MASVEDVDIPPAPGARVRQERDDARDRLYDATYLLERVEWHHQPDETGRACDGCGQTVPCSTRRILDKGAPS